MGKNLNIKIDNKKNKQLKSIIYKLIIILLFYYYNI